MDQEPSTPPGSQGSGAWTGGLDSWSYHRLQEALLAQENCSGQVMSQVPVVCLTLRRLHGVVWLDAGEAMRVDVVWSACQVPEHDLK